MSEGPTYFDSPGAFGRWLRRHHDFARELWVGFYKKAAWTFLRARPPSYRRAATWWVVSAKRPDTRDRYLA